VVGDVHVAASGIELAVDRGRVRHERYRGLGRLLGTRIVIEGGIGGLHEPVADLEGLVGEVTGLPDGEAARVAVPVVVGFADVAHIMDLLTGIVLVDVFGLAIDSAFEVVTTVLYTPETTRQSVSPFSCLVRSGLDSLIVVIKADADLVTLAVTSIVAIGRIFVTATRNLGYIKDLDDGTASLRVSGGSVDVSVGAVRDDEQIWVGWR
jgi:hypothetical protein